MKSKTIKKVLRNKIDSWAESIDDENLRKDVLDNCIVTGGAIASMLLQEEVNDFDIYFTNKETVKKVAEYYVKKFKENPPSTFKNKKEVDISVEEKEDRISIVVKSQGIASEEGTENYEYFEMKDPGDPSSMRFVENITRVIENTKNSDNGNYKPIFLSSNAITLSNSIQLCIRFYGEPEEIHSNYDFVHCTNYWVSKTNELVLREKALEALLARELVYVGSKYPLSSIIRTRKFIKRGFNCNAGQYLKMAYQVSKLNLDDISVLQDQLVGVDMAYFEEIISILQNKNKYNKDFELSYVYLVELIDKIF